ncbi:DNA polymerase III subunit chi [Qipengyuania sp. DGS5-3]|uniref:DNA polymerase III subunit chi n=1 Tax=Qipengyuania sp. DGS5-3 TaxID=3349632 RepID=UPI0036D439C1
MRVDFYQLSRDPVDQVVALLARKVLGAGAKLLVVSGDLAAHEAISKTLWAQDGSAFLAHGPAGGPHDARQPILLSDSCSAANGATMAILADGKWREDAAQFERVLLLFGPEDTAAARDLWRTMSGDDTRDLHIFKQTPDGAWREGR